MSSTFRSNSTIRGKLGGKTLPIFATGAALSMIAPLRSNVNQLAADVGAQHARVLDVVLRTGQQIAVEDNQIGPFACFERTNAVIQKKNGGVIAGVKPDGLLAAERFL